MRAEVRCCCDPGRLLGYMHSDMDRIWEGDRLRFWVQPYVSLRPFEEQRDGALFMTRPGEFIELPVNYCSGQDRRSGDYFSGLAIKSNDTPIAKLRLIKGFEEAR